MPSCGTATADKCSWPEHAASPDRICCMFSTQAFNLLLRAAVKQGAKIAGRVYSAPRNHVGRAPPQQCFTFEGPTRFGAVVLTQIAGFNPKLVRQPAGSCIAAVAADSNSLASAFVTAVDLDCLCSHAG
jgi:hypothetical protein